MPRSPGIARRTGRLAADLAGARDFVERRLHGDGPALHLGQRGLGVQHEGIGVGAELGDRNWDALPSRGWEHWLQRSIAIPLTAIDPEN